MLKELSRTGDLNEMMKVLSLAPKRQSPDHLAVYDLSKLQANLLPRLDELGRKLTEALASDSGQEIVHKAISSSRTVERIGPGLELKDLGHFLALLSIVSSADIGESAKKALHSLAEAVPISTQQGESIRPAARFTDPNHYSGLSFAPVEIALTSPEGEQFALSYEKMPSGWQGFTKAYSRMVTKKQSNSGTTSRVSHWA
jgi:hypothetical protein